MWKLQARGELAFAGQGKERFWNWRFLAGQMLSAWSSNSHHTSYRRSIFIWELLGVGWVQGGRVTNLSSFNFSVLPHMLDHVKIKLQSWRLRASRCDPHVSQGKHPWDFSPVCVFKFVTRMFRRGSQPVLTLQHPSDSTVKWTVASRISIQFRPPMFMST